MSLKTILTVAAIGATLFVAGAGQAQQATPPTPPANPLDNVPEKQPFDIPYGAPISIDRAEAAIKATATEAKKRGWKVSVAVADSGGNLLAFYRMDGAPLSSIDIAQHKARVAVKYRRDTKLFEAGIQANNHYLLTLDDVIASRSGLPLVNDGKLIGGIGCSGATGAQDEVVCKAGIAALAK